MTSLHFTAAAGKVHRPYLPYLKRWLPKSVALIKRPPVEVSIVLVGDKKMAELHQQFMNIPGTTDVLTFELDHDTRGRCTAGEVVVCVPYARREAALRKIAPRTELLLYALHGILHLSGFDDLTPAEHRRMHREEDRILTAVGIGAVFAKPASR
ncbi:MAG: rRNA maturation RNase YbeY [Tepidisphaeraceae bacterium]